MDTVLAQVIAQGQMAGIVIYVIEWLKKSKLPILSWIRVDTKNVNRVVSLVAAALVAGGVSWTYDHATGQLVVMNLTQANLARVAWAIASQMVMQQIGYDVILNRPPAALIASQSVLAGEVNVDANKVVSETVVAQTPLNRLT